MRRHHGWQACVLGQAMQRGFIAQPEEGLERAFTAAETARSLDDNDAECHRILFNRISPPSTSKRRRDWQVRSKRPKIPAKSEVIERPVWVQRSNAVVARVGPTGRSGRDHSTEGWSARIKSALPDLKPAAGAITCCLPPEHCPRGRRPHDEARPCDVHCGKRHCLHR
jgi:hypothetical protein